MTDPVADLLALPDEKRLRVYALIQQLATEPDPATVDIRQRVRWSATDLLATDFPQPRWIVPGIVPSGLVFLSGRPKVGKSWLALQIAHAVGSGGQVLDQEVQRGKVLYLALEDSARRLKSRLTTQGAPGNLDITFITSWPEFGAGGLVALQNEVDGAGYALVIADTLSRILGRADQLDLAQMTSWLGELQNLATTYDLTILAVDHLRKPTGLSPDQVDDVLGSTGKAATADALLALYRERGKQTVILKATGRDFEDKELALEWDALTCTWLCLGNAQDTRRAQMQSAIIDAIRDLANLGELATGTNIARQVGRDRGQVARGIANLLHLGQIVKGPREGKQQPYTLARP